jgi:imidazolonepropionase
VTKLKNIFSKTSEDVWEIYLCIRLLHPHLTQEIPPMKKLFTNIKTLVQTLETAPTSPIKGQAMQQLAHINNAWLLVDGDQIADYGAMDTCPSFEGETIDLTDKMVFPSWCDSHTHLVFATSREEEFVDRINGLSYTEIAAKGGGILNSAKKLGAMSEEDLFQHALQRLEEVKKFGTGAIEIKSGYGLSVEGELKMLRVIKRLKKTSNLLIKSTFLGAHALPLAYKNNREAYIQLIIEEMLPQIESEDLADYIDVFCEKGFFSPEETAQIIKAGKDFGLKPKIHTNQFNCMGGIEVSVENGAISVDHLEVLNDDETACLQNSDTICTLLPSAPFFLNDHYPPARKMLNANLPVALATDFNPGSSPSANMPLAIALACIKMRMLPTEAINAATINGAFAMELADQVGSITKGKLANLIITKPMKSIAYLPYAFGSNMIDQVLLRGEWVL